MTIPINISETPMAQSEYKSIQESNEDSICPKSKQVYHHVLNEVIDIKNEDEIESFSKRMTYRGYENFTDLCVDFHHQLDCTHDFMDGLIVP